MFHRSFSSRLISMRPTYRTSFATGERPPQSHHVICDRYHPQPMREPLKACQLNRPDRRTTAVRTKQTFGFPLAPSLERLNHHPGGVVAAANTKQQHPDRFLSSLHNDDTP